MIDTTFELTATEQVRLIHLENAIEVGLRTFVDVGNALLEIRDARLYRLNYATFEDYCRERWGFTRMHASRLIGAAEVVANVTNWLQIDPPTTESQARPLTVLEPEQQREAWQRAVETAPDGKVTAAHVESVVRSLYTPDSIEEGDGTVTTERVGIVVDRLKDGHRGTTNEVAAWVGLTRFGAWEMLTRLSRVLPITLIDGCWQYVNLNVLESEYGDETAQRN